MKADYLRLNAVARQAYAEVKQRLAEQHRYDRDAYCEGKTTFVTSILSKTMK
ncbi:GrpB-like predicted nucleotidyltransferase (UPF0157 family) [Paenibacillus sp. PastF-3]|uniref:GrpB family protein n=1 Tax=Paenibacillus sp. PastF-3 TaxID=2940626 RepID=UPI002476BCE1|nr:GrpB family protein [Paenibacillus sp. PastF-3]MDH6368935.1 GrpB-like predicted nucleotidyltransferase (UPF0157 family) [Paenibacillus sp. PastF-3]